MVKLTPEIQSEILKAAKEKIDGRYPPDGDGWAKILNQFAKVSADTAMLVLSEAQKLDS